MDKNYPFDPRVKKVTDAYEKWTASLSAATSAADKLEKIDLADDIEREDYEDDEEEMVNPAPTTTPHSPHPEENPIWPDTFSSLKRAFEKDAGVGPEKQPKIRKSSPLNGALSSVDGPILKLFMTSREGYVIGWFDYIDEGFRQLMILNRFVSKGSIAIYADKTPAMSSDTILLPGLIKDADDRHIDIRFRTREDARSAVVNYLEAFSELTSLVRGKTIEEDRIGTKIGSSNLHIY